MLPVFAIKSILFDRFELKVKTEHELCHALIMKTPAECAGVFIKKYKILFST
jgi:hypothetical protein